jgi:hypothetical protein
VTALSHAVVYWRRSLPKNQIGTIANGAFTGLTALTNLYDAGLWGLGYLWVSLLGGCMDGSLVRRALLKPAFFSQRHGMFISFLPFNQTVIFFCT